MIRSIYFRCAMACIALIAAITMMAPTEAAAQDDCRCKTIPVTLEAGVTCRVRFCWASIDGTRRCTTLIPGTTINIPCENGLSFWIVDCNCNYVPLNRSSVCTLGIGAGWGCCTVDACFTQSSDGCLAINIRPSILDVCPCD